MDPVDWQQVLFDAEGKRMVYLERLANRRFPHSEVVAQEASAFAFERITRDDYAQLRKGFSHKASPARYLVAVWTRLLEDFARARYGRYRPAAFVQGNPLLTRVHQLLCRERQPAAAIVHRLAENGEREVGEVERAIREIRGRDPHCGRDYREFNVEVVDDVQQESSLDAEAWLERQELDVVLEAVRLALGVDAAPDMTAATVEEVWPSMRESLSGLREQLQLEDDERLLLRMIFQDGRTVSAAARLMQRPDHEVRRRCKRVLARLKSVLERRGLVLDALPSLGEEVSV